MSLRTRLAFIILGLFTWTMWTRWKGAPWVPSRGRIVYKMLKMADVQPGELVYDLGSGDGRIVVVAAKRFGARAVGVEIDPFRCLLSRVLITILGLRGQVRIVYGDMFSQDLSQANVVTCYLLQETNDRLEDKLMGELRPGTRVVSNTFTFPRLSLTLSDEKSKVFVYTAQDSQPRSR